MPRRPKTPSDKLRDQERPQVMGYDLDRATLGLKREAIDTGRSGDYGSDPIGGGLFRMVPSGDIVDLDERSRRLQRKGNPARGAACLTLRPMTDREAAAASADEILIDDGTVSFSKPAARRRNPTVRDGGASVEDLDMQVAKARDAVRRAVTLAEKLEAKEVVKALERARADKLRERAGMETNEARGYEGSGQPPPAKKGKGKKWQALDEALSLYNGHEGLLVRTALIRPPTYRHDDSPRINGGHDVGRLLAHLKHADQEYMVTLSMNSANRVLAIHESSVGGENTTSVDVRDIVKTVFLSGGSRAIIAHNHPSGDPHPSREDIAATATIKNALSCIGITLLDHVIVARDGVASFHDRGLL